jgi:hypothetical protein
MSTFYINPSGILPKAGDPLLYYPSLGIAVPLVKPLLMPTAGLLAYYPLTANGNDASGNGRHAFVSGSLTFGANGASGFSVANYLSLPASLLAGVSAFTISIKFKVTSASKCAIYYAKGSTSNSARDIGVYNVYALNTTWYVSWAVGRDSPTMTFSPGEEYHMILAWTGSVIACKINMVQQFTANYSDFAGIGLLEHSLGVSQYHVSQNAWSAFNGSIRAVRFYNRVLSTDEQTLLMEE